MLVGIGGKKFSGKTTLAKVFIDHGYQKASFASGLKEYTGKLYDWTLEDLNTQDGKESLLPKSVFWNHQNCKNLSQIIGINLTFKEPQEFKTRRQALEYLGTEVLRDYDENFHINEFKKRFANGLFVCDDLRFPNELEVLKQMNAYCVYIVRPGMESKSQHASENSLSQHDFTNVLLNDGTKDDLYKKGKDIWLSLTDF